MAAGTSGTGVSIVFLAGLASFLSPCVLPLLPAYLSYVGGVSVESIRSGQVRATVLLGPTVLFVLGFSTVFVALGTSVTLIGSFLADNQILFSRVAGALVVVMGLIFLGVVPAPWIYSERRFEMKPGRTLLSNYLMGLAFGFGWTPCIGPTLGATLLIASSQQTASKGSLLLAVYSMGLGIPFILSAIGVSRLFGAVAWLRKHQVAFLRTSGVMLIAFGGLMIFDKVFVLSRYIQSLMESAGLGKLVGI